jgi:hypothetical protein
VSSRQAPRLLLLAAAQRELDRRAQNQNAVRIASIDP